MDNLIFTVSLFSPFVIVNKFSSQNAFTIRCFIETKRSTLNTIEDFGSITRFVQIYSFRQIEFECQMLFSRACRLEQEIDNDKISKVYRVSNRN